MTNQTRTEPLDRLAELRRALDACEPIMGEATPGTGRVVLAWEVPEYLMLRVRDAVADPSLIAEAREAARLRSAVENHYPIPSTEPDDTPVLSCGYCDWDSYSKLAWPDHIRAALVKP